MGSEDKPSVIEQAQQWQPDRAPQIVGVRVVKREVHPDERGRVMEIMRADEPQYIRFGQVYLCTAKPGAIKAWHVHRKQHDNFCCIRGQVRLVLFDDRPDSRTRGVFNEFTIGDGNYCTVQIPPGVCHGFKGVSADEAEVINIPTEPFDLENPDEYRIPPRGVIDYDWSRRDG